MPEEHTIDMSDCECCEITCCSEDATTIAATISNTSGGRECDQITLSGPIECELSIVTLDNWVAPAGCSAGSLTFTLELICDPDTNSYSALIAAEAGDCSGSALHELTDPDLVDCDPFRVEFLNRAITFTGLPSCCGLTDLIVDLDIVFTLP